MAWLTGYDGWSFYVHQAVLVPPEGEPVWFGRGQDANGAKRTAYLTHDNIVAMPTTTFSRPNATRWTISSKIIAERGWGKLTIGVEMDNYWFSAAAFASLQRAFAQRTLRRRHCAGKLAARGEEPDRD